MTVYEKMKKLGIVLPEKPAPGGVYAQAKEFGDKLVYVSGCGPQEGGRNNYAGKLGAEFTLEQGREAAKICMLNVLAVLHHNLGDLGKIRRFVKILAFVAGTPEFYQQPQVVNGGSELLIELFGDDAGRAARSAIGTNALPGNIAVEIEALVELH